MEILCQTPQTMNIHLENEGQEWKTDLMWEWILTSERVNREGEEGRI
jgi:hypothetical protein